MVEQIAFDSEIAIRCGFAAPSDGTYRDIAKLALAAADSAPEGWSVVERATTAPTTKSQLQTGLRSMLDR
jgi:hypothetical protein